jgi:hypothetical protein
MKKLLLIGLMLMASFFTVGCYETSKTVNNYSQEDNASETVNGFTVVQNSVMYGKLTQTIDGLNKFECFQTFGQSDDVDLTSFGAYLLVNGDIADGATPRSDGNGGVDGIKFSFILSEKQLNERVACASEYWSNGKHLMIKSRDYSFGNASDDKEETQQQVKTETVQVDKNETTESTDTNEINGTN